MINLAIVGASYLQVPLIKKAKELGIVTHVFAWRANDEGEIIADFFYPISIVEKDEILEVCKKIGIDGICSIASDLAVKTVNYVAAKLGLVGNSLSCTGKTTNKYNMRKAFSEKKLPIPKYCLVDEKLDKDSMSLPVIVKPTDRSGSRGIMRLDAWSGFEEAVKNAKIQSLEKQIIVEEFVEGSEYSVECISWEGEHTLLAITQKYTTGHPNYIELGHMEPAIIPDDITNKIKTLVFEALDALEIMYGASHSEIMINELGEIYIIEIGARMGGDCIGSHLVLFSTGIDYVKAVIDVALGQEPELVPMSAPTNVAIKYMLNEKDVRRYQEFKREHAEMLVESKFLNDIGTKIIDSSNRLGYYIIKAEGSEKLEKYII